MTLFGSMAQSSFDIHGIFLVALFGSCLTTYGQYSHHSNMHENLFKHNPASITSIEKLNFQLTYRNQWPGSSDFVTYDGSAVASSERLNSSVGIFVLRDSQGEGIISTTSFGFLYAFKLKLGNYWTSSAGLSGSFNLYNVNYNALTFENDNGNLPTGNKVSMFANFSTGIIMSYRDNYKIGFSLSNLASTYTQSIALPGLQFNISFDGHYLLTKRYSQITTYFDPLLWISVNGDHSEILYGGRANFSGILGGMYARQSIDFQFDALIFLLGTQIGNMEFYYTYDLNLSGASKRFSNLAAHEVTFLNRFEYKRKSKKRHGAIKCPDL
jgi:type IX secretion system PorP/SprF family membrane protein